MTSVHSYQCPPSISTPYNATPKRCRLHVRSVPADNLTDSAMAHYEEQAKWPPHDSLSHLAVHAPLQVTPRCGESGNQGMYHPLQGGGPWRMGAVPYPGLNSSPFTGAQSTFYRPFPTAQPQPTSFPFIQDEANKKVAEWQNGNNNKALGEQIWEVEKQKAAEWQQQQCSQPSLTPVAEMSSIMHQPQEQQSAAILEPRDVDMKLFPQTHIASPQDMNGLHKFSTSSLHSPPSTVQSNQGDIIAPKAVHAETSQMMSLVSSFLTPEETKSGENSHESYAPSSHSMTDSDLEERRLEVDMSVEASPEHNPDTIVNGSQSNIEERQKETSMETNQDSEDQPVVAVSTLTTEDHKEEEASSLLLNFSKQSYMSSTGSDDRNDSIAITTSAFPMGTADSPTPATSASQGPSPSDGSSFCRPPGLGPASLPPQTGTNGQLPLVCPICGFSCNSKFHYNSHMNTHGDHQCTMCDYTSRTEGRLKKHMRESHTVEEQLAAGLDIEPMGNARSVSPTLSTPIDQTSGLSTTMASLVDAANNVVSSQASTIMNSNSLASALGIEGLLGSFSVPSSLPSALDQIRAFTENSSILPDTSVNLASALGVMSQAMIGSPDRGELKSNSEPRRNSNGKQKTYKCKQCPHVSVSKDEQWAHARTHIPADKQMSCPKCNFVTEYKHHLEYHIRNHIGSKPFQCKKCSYTCVNKSMLNSHMKSHTNVYQFRCMDCTYATKYCHSLKLHLKKYGHRRVPDGTPMDDSMPTQVMHQESAFQRLSESLSLGEKKAFSAPPATLAQSLGLSPIVSQPSINYQHLLLRQHHMDQMNNLMTIAQPQLACSVCEFVTGSQDELIRHNMSHLLQSHSQLTLPPFSSSLSLPSSVPSHGSHEGIDVVKTEDDDNEHEHEMTPDHDMPDSSGCSTSPVGSSKSSGDEENPSRKRKAFKLDQISQRLQGKSPSVSDDSANEHHHDDENLVGEPSSSPSDVHTDSLQNTPTIAQPVATHPNPDGLNIFQQACLLHLNNALQEKQREGSVWRFSCPHCRMAFQDQALYHIHMGYHGYEHMYKCNRCGHHAPDALNFNLHLLQASHE